MAIVRLGRPFKRAHLTMRVACCAGEVLTRSGRKHQPPMPRSN